MEKKAIFVGFIFRHFISIAGPGQSTAPCRLGSRGGPISHPCSFYGNLCDTDTDYTTVRDTMSLTVAILRIAK